MKAIGLVLCALGAGIVTALPQQLPFSAAASSATIPFALTSLPDSSANDFEVLSHAEHPDHRVRIRTPKGLCDDTVAQKSGYLDTSDSRHFFFYHFESRSDPKNDPIVLWVNGGPGCSSFTGLLQELGPCRIQEKGKDPISNPYSWNERANLIFLDQPVGVGFSYSDKEDQGVWTTEAAAKDLYAFLKIFFEAFQDKFGRSEFFIAGESYAGRYAPVFADYIVVKNQEAELLGKDKINLVGTLIGNGFTNPKIQYASYYPTVCTNQTGYGPFVSEKDCDSMKAALPRCQALIQKCYDQPSNNAVCLSGNQYCEATQTERYYETGRNPYDMLKFGDYAEEKQIQYYLNRDDVRHQLGVDKEAGGGVRKFIGCSDTVGFRFSTTGDQSKPTFPHVAHMVDSGVRTLLYSGKRDMICNWYGNNAWLLELEWSGQTEFNAEPLRPWYASKKQIGEDKQAGVFRASGNLAFAVVDNAGHFVPYDQPANALAMFNSWIFNGTVGEHA